jgi:hypothetical protein
VVIVPVIDWNVLDWLAFHRQFAGGLGASGDDRRQER